MAPLLSRRWDAAAAIVAAAVVGSHVRFFALDGRFPEDHGLYYTRVPDAWRFWGDLSVHAGDLVTLLAARGGWYEALLGAALRVFGRTPEVFDAVVAIWMPLIVVLTGLLARQLAGSAAAVFAVALAGSIPWVVVHGRTPWIHIPEAALVLGALTVWAGDQALERRRTRLVLALTGALAVSLRPSGLVWMAPLAVALAPWRGRRSWWVLAVWGIAAVPALRDVAGEYMSAKLDARADYEALLPSAWSQLLEGLGPLGLLVIDASVLAMILKRRWSGRVGAVVGCWVASAVAMWWIFSVGLDNFVVVAPGVAVLASAAAVAVHPQLAWVPVFALLLSRAPGGVPHPSPKDFKAPWTGFSPRTMEGLFTASCPDGRACAIGVDRGLFTWFGEEPGDLALFLMGHDDVTVEDLRFRRGDGLPAVQAAATWSCPGLERDWDRKYPDAGENLAEVVEAQELMVVWRYAVSGTCTLLWMTPGGELLVPEALPEVGEVLDEPQVPSVTWVQRRKGSSRGAGQDVR